jgi:integral membrane protein (TIGR01906 family)
VSAVVAWDTFFTAFHQLFFAGGTWVFAYSDTLIRLFPEQFWFDAALTVGGLTLLGALALLLLSSVVDRIKRA